MKNKFLHLTHPLTFTRKTLKAMLPKIIKRRVRLINDAVDYWHPQKVFAKKGEKIRVHEMLGDVFLAEYNGTKFLVPKYNLE